MINRPEATQRPKAVRTSESHPLQIAQISVGDQGGLIGITFCPGKSGDSAFGLPWLRDLQLDLDVVERWGAATVVTLIEEHEFTMLKVPDLGVRIMERGIQWRHMPIRDLCAPDQRFEQEWDLHGAALLGQALAGGRVLVHCRGGLGRAGTVAARILIEAGEHPLGAVEKVRRVRPGAIETQDQMAYVRALRSVT